MKKIILLALVSVLLSTAVFVGFVRPVMAQDTIYIRADGSVDPPTPLIQRDGNVYTFTGNINASIVVEKDNIVVDGAGYTLQGTGSGNGIDLSGRSNVTIKNMEIKAFGTGIYLNGSSYHTISGNNITNNDNGIWLKFSSDNIVSENTVTANSYGVYLYQSSNYNSITGNHITANSYLGIELYSSSNNTLSENNITNNNYYGIYLSDSSNSSIFGNNVTNNYYGIWVEYACKTSIYGNNVSANEGHGIRLRYTNGCRILDNIVNDNYDGYGIWLSHSNDDMVKNNTANRNHNYNIIVEYANSTTVVENKANECVNSYGNIAVWGDYCSVLYNIARRNYVAFDIEGENIVFCGNLMENNDRGLRDYSSRSLFYHNNFINNTNQVDSYSSTNTWDNGYPSGGNYWSDHEFVDEFSGPNQDEPGPDGICDTPYVIDENNQDNYPLINSYGYETPPGTYVEVFWKRDNSYNFDVDIEITDSPDSAKVLFWAHQFGFVGGNGGYIGLQLVGSKKKAIFSIWDAIEGNPGNPFTHEGQGWQILIDYDWKLNNKYRLRIWELGVEENGDEWWQGAVYDYVTSTETIIGKILVPASWEWLSSWSVTWIEYAGYQTCDVPYTRAVFSGHYARHPEGDSPPEKLRISYGTSLCIKSDVDYYGGTTYALEAGDYVIRDTPEGFISQRPSASLSASPTTVVEDTEEVEFDASASYDLDGTIVSYRYDYGDGSNSGWVSESVHSRNYPELGEYYAKVKVKDNDGLESDWSDSIKITVESEPENEPPIAYINKIQPNPADEGETVTFQGHGEDEDGYIIEYRWESNKDGLLSTQQSFDTSTLSVGTHTISFKVKDNNGTWSDADTETLIINPKVNHPPVALIDSISPNPSTEGEPVTFEGHGEDSDDSVTEYRWVSSIDGFLSSSASFSTSSLSIGEHVIDFRVKDDDGAWSETVSETISVRLTPDWTAIAEKASLRREKYAYYDDLFDSGWWHEVAMDQIDPYEALFDPLRTVAGELFSRLLEYFTDLGILGPISIIRYAYDISEGLVNLFQAIYYDEIAATLGGAYAHYNIRTEISDLLDAADAVISAANSQDIAALDQAFMQEKQATETVYVGTKKFENAIMAVLEENSIWSSTIRTRIYLELRGYLVGLHSALEENYAYLTQELGETKDLAEEKPEGSFTPRNNLPIVVDAYWQVNGQTVTVAEVGQQVTTHVVLRTINISRTDYDKVHGTVTIFVIKDLAFLPDEVYTQMSFEVTVNAGEIEDVSFTFTPDQKSSTWMRGYYLEVEFTGDYLIAGTTVPNRLVEWTHGGYQMENSYPPRLRAEEAGSMQLSGTIIVLKETQHKLYLHIYDSQGRHLGVNYETNQPEIGILGVHYFDFNNGTIIIILPVDTPDFTIVVDAKYAEEATETYTLITTIIRDEQIMNKKEVQSTIQKGTLEEYKVEISDNGEITITVPPGEGFPLWILGVVAVVVIGTAIASIFLWRRRK